MSRFASFQGRYPVGEFPHLTCQVGNLLVEVAVSSLGAVGCSDKGPSVPGGEDQRLLAQQVKRPLHCASRYAEPFRKFTYGRQAVSGGIDPASDFGTQSVRHLDTWCAGVIDIHGHTRESSELPRSST
jgi:hypothetical protein